MAMGLPRGPLLEVIFILNFLMEMAMQLGTSTITTQGQVSVPMRVRKAYGLLPGTRFTWEDVGGHLVIKPVRYTLDDFARLLPPPTVTITLDEMDDAIASHLQEKP